MKEQDIKGPTFKAQNIEDQEIKEEDAKEQEMKTTDKRVRGTASRALMNMAPNSASAADDMTALMIWAVVSTAPLLAGSSSFSERKKWPPARLLALGSLR